MSDTGNQGNQNNQNANGNNQGAEKTFTQEQVDQIVSERLGREKAKYSNYDELVEKAKKFDEMEEKSKSELEKLQDKYQKAQDKLDTLEKKNKVTQIRKKVAEETGVPAELLPYDTEEECKEYAEKLGKYAKPQRDKYPGLGNARNSTRNSSNNNGTDEHEAARELAHQLFGKGE